MTHLYVVLRNTQRIAWQSLRFYRSNNRPSPCFVDSIARVDVEYVNLKTVDQLKREWKSKSKEDQSVALAEADLNAPRRSTRHRPEYKAQQAKEREEEARLEDEWQRSEGDVVKAHIGGKLTAQLRELREKHFKPRDVAVLFFDHEKVRSMGEFAQWPESSVRPGPAKNYRGQHLVVDSVRAFAGLDRKVIILVHPYSNDDPSLTSAIHWMYIGCSRAVTMLIVVADEEAIRIMKKGQKSDIDELYATGVNTGKRKW